MTSSWTMFSRPARVVLGVVLALCAADAAAQSRVEGTVRAADGTPVAGATVRIESSEFKDPLSATSGSDGRYVFEGVKPGVRARIAASKDGRPIAQAFSLISLWVETIDLVERLAPTRPATAEDVFANGSSSGSLAGIVRAADGRPVAAARILVGDTRVFATTDAGGRYRLERLRPGITVPLRVAATGYEEATREVEVPDTTRVSVDFDLTPDTVAAASGAAMSIVEASADGPSVVLRADRIAGIPAVGSRDVFKAVQFLPGVGASSEVNGDIAVRGTTADQTRVSVDGYTLYQWPSTLAMLGAFNGDVLGRGQFAPSMSSAQDGGRLGGVLELEGASSSGGQPGGFVDLSALGVGGFVNVPFGGRGSVVFGGRRNPPSSMYADVLDAYTGSTGTPVRDRAPRYSGGSLATRPESQFHELSGRLEIRPSSNDRITFSAYDGRDDLNASHDLVVPTTTSGLTAVDGTELPADAVVQVSDVRNQESRGLSAAWERLWSSSASTSVTVSRSEYSWLADAARLLTSPSTTKDYSLANRHGGSRARSETNDVLETTVRADARFGAGLAHTLSLGGEVSSYDITAGLRREVVRQATGGGLFSRLEPLVTETAARQVVVGYLQDAWRPSSRILLAPGLRVARYDGTGETFLEPRAILSVQVTPQFRLKGGWSIDHQVVQKVTHEDRWYGDSGYWTLADGDRVPVARAQQVSAGASIEGPGLLFNVEGYYKALDDLVVFAPRLFPGVAPATGATTFHRGTGTARGLEATLQHSADGNTVWASYTMGRVEYEYPTLESGVFAASHDQLHEFKITDTFDLIGGWSVSGAWVVGSGRPYTSAQGVETVWFPTGESVYNVTFGSRNAARLPAYHRLDLSTQRDFTFGRLRSSLGVTVFNVYDRKNVAYYEYDTTGETLTGNEVLLMGRALNVRLRIGF